MPINGGADNERDSLNQGDPENDAEFAGALVDTLIFLNNALADDLDSFGLARCSTGAPGSIDSAEQISACINVAAPVVIPDVITLNITQPGGWPNGRHPDDPVVDRLLAAALLAAGDAAGAVAVLGPDVERGWNTPEARSVLAQAMAHPGFNASP